MSAYETAVTAEDVLRTAQVRLCLLQKEEAPEIAHRLLWAAQCELDQATLALWRLGPNGLDGHRANYRSNELTVEECIALAHKDLDFLVTTLRLLAVRRGDKQPQEGSSEFISEPLHVSDTTNSDFTKGLIESIDQAQQVLADVLAQVGGSDVAAQ